jgi:hypothetical protein
MKRILASAAALMCASVLVLGIGGVAGASSSQPLSIKQAGKALTTARVKANIGMAQSLALIKKDATVGSFTFQKVQPDVQPWLAAAKAYRNRLTSIAWPAKYQADAENLIAQLAVLSGQLASAQDQDATTIGSWTAQLNTDTKAYNAALHKLQTGLGLRRTTDFSTLPVPVTTTTTVPTPTSAPAPIPTVGPCASAPSTDIDFEPDTLGFNCTSGGSPDALTDITWTSWTSGQASGNGTLMVGSQVYPNSDVTLSDPEQPAQGANAFIFQDATVETPSGLTVTGSTPGEWGTAS